MIEHLLQNLCFLVCAMLLYLCGIWARFMIISKYGSSKILSDVYQNSFTLITTKNCAYFVVEHVVDRLRGIIPQYIVLNFGIRVNRHMSQIVIIFHFKRFADVSPNVKTTKRHYVVGVKVDFRQKEVTCFEQPLHSKNGY